MSIMAETNNAVFEGIATRFVENYAMFANFFKDTELNKTRAIKSLTDTYKLTVLFKNLKNTNPKKRLVFLLHYSKISFKQCF